jgi:LacI family transcriptional regulator
MPKKVNIKTIASELGVSPSTVSKALKDSHEIGAETRAKIQAFAKMYNYKPNSLALSLRNQKTMIIGVIIPQITHHFFTRVISGIEYIANQHDYNLMICLSKDKYDKEIQNIEMLTNGRVDGLLISAAKETLEKGAYDHFQRLIDEEFPLVFFDRVPPGLKADKVVVDDIAGGHMAANFLLDKGHKNLAILSTPEHVTVGLDREKGFVKAIEEHDMEMKPEFKLRIDESQDIELQINKLFSTGNYPDGIFAVNEIYAAHAMKVIQRIGLQIPKDVSIIGFTDGIIPKLTSPSMTVIAQHGYNMGNKAAELVLNIIQEDDNEEEKIPYQTVVIATDVVEREST